MATGYVERELLFFPEVKGEWSVMTKLSRQDRITACLFAGANGDALGAVFEGSSPPSKFSVPSDLPDSRVRDRLADVYAQSPSVAEYAAAFGTTGHVVDAVPCAILAAVDAKNLLVMLGEIIACEGDTDTISAMAAQILGASRGPCVLPSEILDRIDLADLLRENANQLGVLDIGMTP